MRHSFLSLGLTLLLPACALISPICALAQVTDEAREAVAEAQALYEGNRFEEAGAAFEAAYDVTAHPAMIYNAYVAYRDAGLPREALRTLRRHLALISANDPERDRLEARLRGLEQQVEAVDRGDPAPDDGAGPSSGGAGSGDETSSSASAGGADLMGPVITLSAGAAVLVAGAVLGGVTLAEHDAFVADCGADGCPELADDASRGQTLALTSDVLLAVGAAVAVVGLVWLIVELASSDEPQATSLRCGPFGCGSAF